MRTMARSDSPLLNVTDAGRALGVSRSTVWRMIRRGTLPAVVRAGRRLIPAHAIESGGPLLRPDRIPPLRADHPIFRLVGAGRSGGVGPGARDKHAITDLHRR